MTKPILILNGPNLNLLGQREPAIYGTATLEDHAVTLRSVLEPAGMVIEHVQSNHEGVLIDALRSPDGRTWSVSQPEGLARLVFALPAQSTLEIDVLRDEDRDFLLETGELFKGSLVLR